MFVDEINTLVDKQTQKRIYLSKYLLNTQKRIIFVGSEGNKLITTKKRTMTISQLKKEAKKEGIIIELVTKTTNGYKVVWAIDLGQNQISGSSAKEIESNGLWDLLDSIKEVGYHL